MSETVRITDVKLRDDGVTCKFGLATVLICRWTSMEFGWETALVDERNDSDELGTLGLHIRYNINIHITYVL